ncbi:hypothetical protein AaE_001542, partial [Aphanomyces astaci]
EGLLRVYRLVEGASLVLVHTTELDGIPYAMCEFQGRLLVSVGKILRIYDLGKKKMLRKCENRNFPSTIVKLTTAGARIYASDNHHSLRQPHALGCASVERRAQQSRAGIRHNIYMQLMEKLIDLSIYIMHGAWMVWVVSPFAFHMVCQFYVGETITSMVRTRLVPVGKEAIVYTTVMGRIGALIPFSSRVDVDFATHLEMYMRQEAPPLCGRDHLSYRSYFIPVKDVADGDLCDQFGMLSAEKQLKIAQDMDQTPMEVLKKLEDIRNGLL